MVAPKGPHSARHIGDDFREAFRHRALAEFVENDEILARIRDLGVDCAQGFGIEKPVLLESL